MASITWASSVRPRRYPSSPPTSPRVQRRGHSGRHHDRQPAGLRGARRYQRHRPPRPAIADLLSQQPDHGPVGPAGVGRQYRDLALATLWRLHLDYRRYCGHRRSVCDQRFHLFPDGRAYLRCPDAGDVPVVLYLRILLRERARPFYAAPAGNVLADLFHAVLYDCGPLGWLRLCRDWRRYHRADADRLFLHRRGVPFVDGLGQWRRAHPRRPLDAPELTDGRTRRHHPPAAAAENHG